MIHASPKPVRRCHACPLNRGDRCWGYANPRAQWRRRAGCPACADAAIHALYRHWLKQATVKTPHDIRRECIHHLPPEPVYYLEPGAAPLLQALRAALSL